MRRVLEASVLSLLAPAALAGELAFVTCQNGDALSVLDLETKTEIARWHVPGQPAGIAVSSEGSVFTVSPDSKTVRRFSGADGSLEAESIC